MAGGLRDARIAIVKGETPAADRTWMTFADGTARRVAVRAAHDLPHLVVESLFGLDDGLWGALARGGFSRASRSVAVRTARTRLATGEPFGKLAEDGRPGQLVAKAATNAVINRWRDGPDTPEGVRARMRASDELAGALAARLDDRTIRQAIDGVRRLCAQWSVLPPGGKLRLEWAVSGLSWSAL